MHVLLVSSASDPAGALLHRSLTDALTTDHLGEHRVSILVIEGSLLEWTPPEGYDLIIFLSRHSAASGVASLCVHAIGNFGEARMGGMDRLLVPTHPGVLTALYTNLRATEPVTALGPYAVSLEAVHHGPYTTTPSIFLELGSAQEHWADAQAARIVIGALLTTLGEPIPVRESFFGFGSNHYCAGFSELTERFDFAGSCAKYALDDLNEDQVRWIAARYDHLVLDKDSGSRKARVVGLFDELGLTYEYV